jgi:hypothetical protein
VRIIQLSRILYHSLCVSFQDTVCERVCVTAREAATALPLHQKRVMPSWTTMPQPGNASTLSLYETYKDMSRSDNTLTFSHYFNRELHMEFSSPGVRITLSLQLLSAVHYLLGYMQNYNGCAISELSNDIHLLFISNSGALPKGSLHVK